MSNQVFHYSNSGISSGQRFYLKDDVSGIFLRNLNIDSNFPVVASNLVYNTGNQNISGIKTFDVFPIVSGNKLITGLDLSSYATTTNLASTGSTLATSINSLSGLFTGYTGNLDTTYASDSQLATTGSTLDTKINNLSGYVTGEHATFASITNLTSTGSTLDTKINNLSGVSVLTFGNQNISGNKTFVNNIQVSGTGIFNAVDFNNIDIISLSGVDISITNGNVALTNRPTVNGTGVLLSGEASAITLPTTIVYTTGDQIISGNKTFISGVTFSGQNVNVIDASLNLSGVGDMTFEGTNINFINSPVFISGTNLRVSGGASFTTRPIVNGTGVLLSGEASAIILPTTIVYTTGDQTINGLKTFTSGIDIYSGTSPQSIRIFNSTGTNSGEFGLIGWRNNQLMIGSQQSQSGILRDVLITGNNININGSGILNIFDNTNIVGNLNITGALNVTGLVVSGLGTPFILKSASNANSVYFDPALNGNAGILYANYVNTIGLSSIGDLNLSIGYGGGGTRDLLFTKSSINRAILDSNGNFGIGSGISSVPSRFYVSGNSVLQGDLTVSGNTTITGHLSASSKSFLIDHPTQVGKKLQYGSLEGPEHGVFVRGKTNDNIISLPNYWPALVDENSISVNLTPIGATNNIYVVDYNNTRIITNGNNGNYYFYTVYGERKDIPKLTVEF